MSRRRLTIFAIFGLFFFLVNNWKGIWNTLRHSSGQPLIVNSLADRVANCPFVCTLRGALEDSFTQDRIIINAQGKITLIAGRLTIAYKELTIIGPGSGQLSLDGNSAHAMLINLGGQLTLSGLSLSNVGPNSHALQNANGGRLTLNDVSFSNNHSDSDGAALYNEGEATLDNTRFSKGAQGGAIYNAGTLSLRNSSFSQNQAQNAGGAIFATAEASTRLSQTTFTENSAPVGPNIAGAITSEGGNQIDNAAGASGFGSTDTVGQP
jgi:predicted outer membrane repeat protein